MTSVKVLGLCDPCEPLLVRPPVARSVYRVSIVAPPSQWTQERALGSPQLVGEVDHPRVSVIRVTVVDSLPGRTESESRGEGRVEVGTALSVRTKEVPGQMPLCTSTAPTTKGPPDGRADIRTTRVPGCLLVSGAPPPETDPQWTQNDWVPG